MLPVAIGIGDGADFYRPMAIAIIGGTITATMLTLLVVPAFYDSIEVAHDRMFAKFHRRESEGNVVLAFLATFVEAIFTLLGIRALYRLVMRLRGRSIISSAGA
jgi:hypothetical protein